MTAFKASQTATDPPKAAAVSQNSILCRSRISRVTGTGDFHVTEIFLSADPIEWIDGDGEEESEDDKDELDDCKDD